MPAGETIPNSPAERQRAVLPNSLREREIARETKHTPPGHRTAERRGALAFPEPHSPFWSLHPNFIYVFNRSNAQQRKTDSSH